MKLPEADRAIVDRRKLTEYCLNPAHDDGRHKAALFEELVGVTVHDADLLLAALRNAALTGAASVGRSDKYGQRYTIDFEYTGPAGAATIRSVWIVRTGEEIPRLVTCYIL